MQIFGVFVAAIAYYAICAFWYPGKLKKKGMQVTVFLTFLCCLVGALTLGTIMDQFGIKHIVPGLIFGSTLGFGLVAMAMFPNYLVQQKPKKLFLKDAGYQVLGVTIAAVIIGYFRGLPKV